MLAGGEGVGGEPLEAESQHAGRVVAIRRGDVFVELGGREQGCLPLHQFDAPPNVGDVLQVTVQKLNPEDGLYHFRLPDKAVEVGDWSDLNEGMLVEVQVTGHNTGGLECEINHIRGFIPVSQVALYRVEDLAQFVGQRMACLITEANPARRNLVLSRRAVLEREKEERGRSSFAALAPGDIYEGVVRKLMDFGAFVDIGGVDGLLHVSQLAWSRVAHPREVLTEGQKIRVRVERIDRETGKISLAYRDMLESPWTNAEGKYPPNSVVRGKVTKLMEFGAFRRIGAGRRRPGPHSPSFPTSGFPGPATSSTKATRSKSWSFRSTWRPSGSVLSMKALSKPEPTQREKEETQAQDAVPAQTSKKRRHRDQPLQGGLGKAGGERFGLNW